MRDDQGVELAKQLAVAAELDVELHAVDHRAQPFLVEPGALGAQQSVHCDAAERRPAPQSESALDHCARRGRLARLARLSRLAERLMPAVYVALAVAEVEPVAAGLTEQPLAVGAGRGQRLAQARDVHLQAVPRARRR